MKHYRIKPRIWCRIIIQRQMMHIGENKLLGHLHRIYNIPTTGYGFTRKLNTKDWEFNFWDEDTLRIIEWRKK